MCGHVCELLCASFCVRASVCELLCANCDTLCDYFFCSALKQAKLFHVVEVPPPSAELEPQPSPTPTEVAVAQLSRVPSEVAEDILAAEGDADNNFGGEDSEE